MLLAACGDIEYQSGSYESELVEITDEATEADTDTSTETAEDATEPSAVDEASAPAEEAQEDSGTEDDLFEEYEDPYGVDTDAVIVSHGSLYPEGFDPAAVPAYSGKKYVLINDGVPFFSENDESTGAFEYYSSLDELGRCGTAYANICPELMPSEKRGDISEIHPTGWKQKRYDGIVDADPPYLYNRSHLIAHKLAGENANLYNLITGTRYFNADGMTYVEDRVADYVKNTGNHVLYRVTPVFEGDELVARGVLMEAKSVENDKICFCEFVYNVQPGVYIDYATGDNHAE